jgi:MioC protein
MLPASPIRLCAIVTGSRDDRRRWMTTITILVGTMTGNAEYAAEELQQVLRDEYGCHVEFLLMDKLGPEVFKRESVFLICTSTYGQGDVPDNAQALYKSLDEQRPDLSGVRYAVFGLGDSTYCDTFNFGGQKFDELLASLGARRLGQRAKHDASTGEPAEDFGREWIREWYEDVVDQLA